MACCSADATGCSDVVLTVGALVNFVLRRRRGEFSGRHLRLGIVTVLPRLVDRVAGSRGPRRRRHQAARLPRPQGQSRSWVADAEVGPLVVEIRGRADLAFVGVVVDTEEWSFWWLLNDLIRR